MAPRISVVIPVLNGARFIDRAMGYLRSQTFRDFEIVMVVDTRSTDGSPEIAGTYSDTCRIILKDTEGALGVSRNIGRNAAEGEFIWYMDVDDRPLPELLERMTSIQREHDADIVGCNFIYSSRIRDEYDFSKYRFKVHVMDSGQAIDARARERFPVTAWSKIYRRSMLEDNHIEFSDTFCEDIEYTYRTLSAANTVCYTEEPLYVYFQHDASYCMNNSRSDNRGQAELSAYDRVDSLFDTEPTEGFDRRNALTRIRSSGHMTYRTFIQYARSEGCRDMLRKHCSDPVSPEAVWYRISPSTYYIVERVFFKLLYYRDGRIYTDPRGLIGMTRPKVRPRHSVPYVPSIPDDKRTIPVTIGICAYNEEGIIERTIRAIFDQVTEHCEVKEVLVVSSGSTDSTDDIVTALSKEFDKVRLLPQERREGKNSAINLILDSKSTDTVVLLNADNVFENEHSLENLILPLQDPDVGMVGGHPIPTNSPRTTVGFTVQLMWRMHHHVSLQYPKTGELIAFRDVGTRLPTDMQSDEDILRMKLEDRGYRTVYSPKATILNRGPTTKEEYVKQRLRVNIGEFYLKERFGYELPTHNYRLLASALMRSLGEMGFHPVKTVSAIWLELHSRRKAKVHVSAGGEDMSVWEPITTTKRL